MILPDNLIINNRLQWNGDYLGEYSGIITTKWTLKKIKYCGITLPQGWSKDNLLPGGIIYCIFSRSKNMFPYIVEDIKTVFEINRRGIHRITIDKKEYILYYIPITLRGEVIWETPLNKIDSNHGLRKDDKFKVDVRRLVAFCDILALSNTAEYNIHIRPGTNESFIPINVNECSTTISRETEYDYSILTKSLFYTWFGEHISIGDVVKDIIYDQSLNNSFGIQISQIDPDNIAIISAALRTKIDEIIKRWDANYIWYSSFIIDRMCRHLI